MWLNQALVPMSALNVAPVRVHRTPLEYRPLIIQGGPQPMGRIGVLFSL